MERKIGKCIAVVVAAVTVITLAAASSETKAVSGGWKNAKARYSFLNKSQKKVFKKATKNIDGVSYKPVALLAKQVVAGTNYVYLCQGETVTAKPKKNWYILTAGKSLDNKVTLVSSKKISLKKIKTTKNPRTETASGGFEIVKIKNKPAALSKGVRKVFKKGIKKYTGYELRPIALLGTQTVAGKNYRFLCYAAGHAGKDVFVVDIYKDLKGKCKLSSCKSLKLESYAN